MKKIAASEKNHLRQEYILYTKEPENKKYKKLIEDDKYTRFRFLSNNWKNIEEYIIGTYENLKGYGNDSIYANECIHVFYDPKDEIFLEYFYKKYRNK